MSCWKPDLYKTVAMQIQCFKLTSVPYVMMHYLNGKKAFTSLPPPDVYCASRVACIILSITTILFFKVSSWALSYNWIVTIKVLSQSDLGRKSMVWKQMWNSLNAPHQSFKTNSHLNIAFDFLRERKGRHEGSDSAQVVKRREIIMWAQMLVN